MRQSARVTNAGTSNLTARRCIRFVSEQHRFSTEISNNWVGLGSGRDSNPLIKLTFPDSNKGTEGLRTRRSHVRIVPGAPKSTVKQAVIVNSVAAFLFGVDCFWLQTHIPIRRSFETLDQEIDKGAYAL